MRCPYCHSDNTLVFLERKMPAVLSAYSGDFPVKVSELQVSACKDCLVGFAWRCFPNRYGLNGTN